MIELERHLKHPWHIKLRLLFTAAYASQDMGDYVVKFKALRVRGRKIIYFERATK